LKTDLECIPCVINQTLSVLRLAGSDEYTSRKVVKKVLRKLEDIDYGASPAVNSNIAYHTASEITGIADPYRESKIRDNTAAMEIYPQLKKMVQASKNRLHSAARMAVAGNVIDLGINLMNDKTVDMAEVIDEIKNIPLARDDYDAFYHDLEDSGKILYLADNAGEIVFDRVFIEQMLMMGKTVVLSVKSGPIINDVTRADMRQTGLDSLVMVIETGNNCIGVDLGHASPAFLKEFEDSDMIISKGQGNFESLDEIKGKKVFFLLKAKCKKIARELGVGYLETVFMKSKYYGQ